MKNNKTNDTSQNNNDQSILQERIEYLEDEIQSLRNDIEKRLQDSVQFKQMKDEMKKQAKKLVELRYIIEL
jgi:ElaB/YqjD/DUF883 family membrane-anchored ribosome-binding protein